MRLRVIGPVVLLAGLLPSYAVEAQSLLWSTVTGTVADAAGQPVRQALVTLTPLGASGGTEVTTDGSGRFSFPLVSPGEYSVRAEALGYRPVVARGLSVAAAAEARVDMVMDLAAPPVLGVDTVDAGSVASAQGGTQISLSDIDALPTRFEDLSSLLQLVPRATRSHGLAGLPGSMPLLVADGVPVYGARHPVADGSHVPAAAFPVSVVSTLRVFEAAPDVELSGTAAGHALLGTRTGTTMDGLEFEGAWSGDPLWSSSELDLSAPPMTSVRAAGRGTIEVSPGRSALAVMADVLRQENPLAPRLTETEAEALVGLDPGLVADLVQPSVETFSRYSALARFDGEASERSRFFVRGAAGYLVRQFDGPGPVTLTRSAPLPEETLDYSVAAGYAAQSRPGLLVEVRGGISGSDRTFEAAADGAAAAYLAATGSVLGVLPRGAGESGRTDVVLNPATHIALGSGTLKLGGSVRASRHTMSHDFEGELLFADAASLLAQEGVARARDGSEASFSTRELGLFAQYRFAPSPRVGVTLGARYDRESVSGVEGTLDDDWLAVSGLRNDEYPTAMDQVGALASFTWDPRGDGSTRLELGSSVHHGDVDIGAYHEMLASATASSFVGSGLSWPTATIPAGATTLPTLTLLGPDTRAPRSFHSTMGLTQRLGGGWSVSLEGAYRRTDFLLRRRNLNAPVALSGEDAYGRDVFGTLQKNGSLVTALGDDARRFSGFQEVWALDPDGSSEYRGATLALRWAGSRSRVSVAYTRSEATDNWVGADAAAVDAELGPRLPSGDGWTEGTSDFDTPDRLILSGSYMVGPVTASGLFQYRSGYPFTPGYRVGVDANGDGSFRNDVAFVDGAIVDALFGEWPCLADQVGGFADRNSCRGPAVHTLDVRLHVRLGAIRGREAGIVIEGLDVIESQDGVIDSALLLVDPAASITTTGRVTTIPVVANPGFGRVIYPSSTGRMIRVGFRIG